MKAPRASTAASFFRRYCREGRGATVIEYALIACGVSIAIAAVVYVIGDDLLVFFEQVADSFNQG